ncbi:phosphatase PAP2 family protein [Shewanella aegiceratis]|uniref:phosphatase PAP2 family protein n=1 Tax=Shewanella aegiceratis TaxID=2864203 RepID=UPI001C65DABE|nr:phosphatase PAP2 family protein [Shewanella aegiceratis]QYJ81458.1 phosphatase PAP2 family protein [Shewanella aegiceratis]
MMTPRASVKCLLPTLMAASLASPTAYGKSEILEGQSGTVSEVGDVVQIALPAAGLIGALWIGDTEGAWQVTKGVAATAAITHTLKFGVERLRPDGTESNSFPSGHTSAAFSGAAFIHHRYGNAYGIPAYAAAAFVGGSRIWANRHYMDDVLAGGSIAVMTSLYFTDPYAQTDLVIAPSLGEDHIGLALSYTPGLAGNKGPRSEREKSHDWGQQDKPLNNSYTLMIGGFDTDTNYIRDKQETGFDLNGFSKESEPNTYASALVNWGMGKQQYLSFRFTPLEARDTSVLNQDIGFNGKRYAAGSEVIAAYRSWNLSADYMFNLMPKSDWIVNVGAGISLIDQWIRLDDLEGGNLGEFNDFFIVPAAAAELGYRFTPAVKASLGYRITGLSDFDSSAFWGNVTYQINERWAASLFYGQLEQTSDTDEYYNDARFNFAGFAVTYSF